MTRKQWNNPVFRRAYYRKHRHYKKRAFSDRFIMGMLDRPHQFGVYAEMPGGRRAGIPRPKYLYGDEL